MQILFPIKERLFPAPFKRDLEEGARALPRTQRSRQELALGRHGVLLRLRRCRLLLRFQNPDLPAQVGEGFEQRAGISLSSAFFAQCPAWFTCRSAAASAAAAVGSRRT